MKKLRILTLNYEFPPLGGGASPVSYNIAREFVSAGNHVDVVTMSYRELPEYEVKEGVHIYRVSCLRKYKEICRTHEMLSYVISAKRFLKKHLSSHSYDICHCHFIIPTGILAYWLFKKYSIPYVLTSHGSDVPGYNPDRFKFEHRFTKPLLRRICGSALGITVPSDYLAELISENIGEERTMVIPNGITDFSINGFKKEKIILSSGRLLKRKGFDFIIRAFKELNPEGWKLYIAGDGPCRSELELLAGNNKEIIFTGWLDNTEKKYKELVNRASIFAMLSSNESQGMVYLEAMTCGCAVLASDITGCIETVTDDVGFKVNPRNINEIKEKLNLLINDTELRAKFMKNSKKRYEDLYMHDAAIENYIDFFQKLFKTAK